jgi:monoamine oxidase
MKVGIVGLGFAGLRTACLLERAGIDVELFEARGRPGGRMYSADEGDGVLYEAGGEWIDADHARVLKLLKDFNLEPDARSHWPQKLVYKGKQTTEHLVWNDALEDDLRFEAAAREMCRELRNPPWENTEAVELDARRLDDFVRENTSSERGQWWVNAKYRSDEGDDLDRIGLLGWLSGYLHYLDREGDVMSAYRIPGGSRQLCEKMVKGLVAEPQFGAILRRIRQNGDGVRLIFEDGIADVDKVVLTLPPPCLERVVFDPPLTVQKRCAIEACGISRAVKIVWHFDRPWWEDEEWGGSMLCDTALQQTWNGGMGEAAVLTAYVCGEEAVRWTKLGDPVSAGMYELGQLFPKARSHFVRGWFHNWISDPYSKGAFSHLAPGYVLEHMSHIAPAEGRIFFAGEHTSLWIGFLEGALESAERVVRELVGSLSR